jgi:hypothetical protein
MADIANRYEQNVTGHYFVDNQCIDCDLCRETAPKNFTRWDEVDTPTSSSSRRIPRKKPSARKPKKAARSKPSATTHPDPALNFIARRRAAPAGFSF